MLRRGAGTDEQQRDRATLVEALERRGVVLLPGRDLGDSLLAALTMWGMTFHVEDVGERVGIGEHPYRVVVVAADGRRSAGRVGEPAAEGLGWALVRLLDAAAETATAGHAAVPVGASPDAA